MSLPNPDVKPMISVPEAAAIVGIGARAGYLAAQRGDWPVLRTGRAVRVRTRLFLEQYGLLDEATARTAP